MILLSMPVNLPRFLHCQVVKWMSKFLGLKEKGPKESFLSFLTELSWCFWNHVTPSPLKSGGKLRLALVVLRKMNCCVSGEDKQENLCSITASAAEIELWREAEMGKVGVTVEMEKWRPGTCCSEVAFSSWRICALLELYEALELY